jgi:hypothetical protein
VERNGKNYIILYGNNRGPPPPPNSIKQIKGEKWKEKKKLFKYWNKEFPPFRFPTIN